MFKGGLGKFSAIWEFMIIPPLKNPNEDPNLGHVWSCFSFLIFILLLKF